MFRRRFTASTQNRPVININNYLTIEALSDGIAVRLDKHDCEYCVDGDGNWKPLAAGVLTQRIKQGHILSFRSELTPNAQGIGTFYIDGKCNIKGDCMSMIFGDNASINYILPENAFCYLFQHNLNIINCEGLILKATTLAKNCYRDMFYGCTSLTTAPVLPATTLVESCYSQMFFSCTNLNYIKMLATDISASSCLSYWVYGVANTGTFVKNAAISSLPTGSSGIPRGWVVQNA